MASMRERPPGSGSWELRIHVGGDVYKSRTFRGSRKEAQVALARLVTDEADHKVPLPGQGTVGQLLEEWHAKHPWKTQGSPELARQHLDRYLIPLLGSVPLSRLTHQHVDRLYSGLLDGTLACRGPMAKSTVRRLHATLHSALEWAVRKERLPLNPASKATAPVAPPAEIKAPDVAEVRYLIAAARPELSVFVELAAATGRRRQDLLGLQWKDLDLDRGTLTFARRVVLTRAGLVIEALDKNGRGARIGLPPSAGRRLEAHVLRLREKALTVGLSYGPRSWVFSHDGAQPWRPDATTRAFGSLVAACGLEGVTLHTLRHFHITELLTAGVDVETVAKRVGDDPRTIYKTYSHFRPAADQAAAALIGDILSPAADVQILPV